MLNFIESFFYVYYYKNIDYLEETFIEKVNIKEIKLLKLRTREESMSYCFHKMNKYILQFDTNTSYQKIRFNHYIMRKVNLNNMKSELPTGHFKISMRSAASDLDISVSTVYNLLKSFEVLNIIRLIRKGGKDHSYSIYKYITDEENQKTVLKTVIKNDIKTVQYSDIKNLTNLDETLKKTHKKIDSQTSNIENINKDTKIYSSVIDYLNKKTNKNFKPRTNKTMSCIDARLKEGFTVEDFYKVIDIKSKKWLNTDMEQFLRPHTLFSNKFEGYLNENQMDYKEDLSKITPWEVDFEY